MKPHTKSVTAVPADLEAAAERLLKPIYNVWCSIGHEACQLAEEYGEPMSLIGAMEFCLDADHLETIARDKEANDLVNVLYKKHGYDTVLKFLASRIPL